ncbi:hypothetical protein [Pantoea sp. CFSAN033090]|uniref:hypothetical protein n=1 Tax=Pantoea sp. CFSAN033090 TaxID=1690502 RepID=UPI00068C8558|nr:hypothetical protein [Pantoea sp. CFSAN033090]KOA70445.1 hypothetical protein AFL22_11035 [Pantoea sp. CFSAN033090]
MAYGFGTWDASGLDNNTGLVKINALGVMPIDATSNYNQAFSLPAGYSLDYLFQASGDRSGNGRKKIYVSGSNIVVGQVSGSDYSAGTFPNVPGNILVFVR